MIRHGEVWLLADVDLRRRSPTPSTASAGTTRSTKTTTHGYCRFLADARHEEPQHFAQMLKATNIGSQTLLEWQEYVASCRCPDLQHGDDGCQVHATIQACHNYCDLIDADWLKIADWYRPGSTPRRGISGSALFAQIGREQVRTPATPSSKYGA